MDISSGDVTLFVLLVLKLSNVFKRNKSFYYSALKTCSVELLLKVGTLLPEMAAHEKSLDYFIDLLRKDQVGLHFY